MKENTEDRMLGELFRRKLENAEIMPSLSVSTNLMRRVGRKEFLHFNPARFNIWYAGGIAVAGAALAIFLSSESDKDDKKLQEPSAIEITNPANSKERNTANKEAYPLNTTEKAKEQVNETQKSTAETSKDVINEKVENVTPEKNEIISTPADLVSSLNKNGVLNQSVSETNKLKVGTNYNPDLIETTVTEGCTPLKIGFNYRVSSGDSCVWNFGDGGSSSLKSPVWIFDNAGEYKVILQVYGSEGLRFASSTVIKVYAKPSTRFEITPEKAILPDDQIVFHNYTTGAERYRWDFGDGNSSELFEPMYSYSRPGKYNIRLVAYSDHGCMDSLTVYNAFSATDNFIKFPNAFIPNPNGPSGGYYTLKSDEASQVFHPVFSGVSDYQLRIFNRRGILIFESNDVNIGWDGYYKGQMSDPGVYIWKVSGNFLNGETFTKMGDVTLLKN